MTFCKHSQKVTTPYEKQKQNKHVIFKIEWLLFYVRHSVKNLIKLKYSEIFNPV